MSLFLYFRSVLCCVRAPCHVSTRSRSTLSAKVNEESQARYSPGGYHPVRIGDSFKDGAYKVLNKLGYGQYSTVWLAQDIRDNCCVALKIMTADAFDEQKPTFELDILRQLATRSDSHQGSKHILQLIDHFRREGPNGEHVCLVVKGMGPDLAKYRRLFSNARIPVIHTDIKPQNILIETAEINQMFCSAPSGAFAPDFIPDPPNDFYLRSEQMSSGEEDLNAATDLSIRLTDFNTSSWFGKHLTEWIQPPMLRAPEVILGANWGHRVDIWNLGTLIWELVEGKVLFDGRATSGAPYTPEAHLAPMIAVLGEIPRDLLAQGNYTSQYFDQDGKLLMPSPFSSSSYSLGRFSDYPDSLDKKEYLEFLDLMLRLAPEERHDALSLLEAQWLRE